MTNAEGAWPNLSSKQAIRVNLVYIVSLSTANLANLANLAQF